MSDETNPLRDAIREAIDENPVILFMKGTPEQPMCSLGTLAGMISNYYNWLTVAEDRKIVRLTPNAQPGSLASGLEDGFRGTVLKLWIFSIEPNMTGTLRAS